MRHTKRRTKKRVSGRRAPRRKKVSGVKRHRGRRRKVSGMSTGAMVLVGGAALLGLYLLTRGTGQPATTVIRQQAPPAPSNSTILEVAGITAAAGLVSDLIDQ
jgi:hypothetical protein